MEIDTSRSGKLDDSKVSVQQTQEVLELMPEDHTDRLHWLENLASKHLDRYKKTRALDDIELSIQTYQKALDFALENCDRARLLESLGQRFRNRYELTGILGNIEDLELSIRYNQQALDLTPSDLPGRVSRLENLGDGYRDRYLVARTLDDLDLSIQSFRQALDLIPQNHDQAYCLSNLGDGFRERYKQNETLDDLEFSIQSYQKALTIVLENPGQAYRPVDPVDVFRELCFSNLGNVLRDRYDRTGILDDLDLSIQSFQQALDLTTDDYDRAYRLAQLGDILKERYDQTGEPDDLELSIQNYQEALNFAEEDHDRAYFLGELGSRFNDRYEQTRTLDDLDVSIQIYKQALDLIPLENHSNRMDLLENLGSGYRDRFKETGALDDATCSNQFLKQALDLVPEEDQPDRVRQSWNLGTAYANLYKKTGSLDNLDFSIQLCQEALNLTPGGESWRARRLESLGSAYRDRYSRIGAADDLELSIKLWKEALDLALDNRAPDSHSDRIHLFERLGQAYTDRYKRTEVLDDLEVSIQYFQKGINLASKNSSPSDHSDRARRLANLGVAYANRHTRTETLDDLELSTKHFREALDLVPDNHPDKAYLLGNSARGFLERYERTRTLDYLEVFIQYTKEALDCTSDDDPDRAYRLEGLGLGYDKRYQHTGVEHDLELCILHYEDSLNHKPSPPTARLSVGKKLLAVYARAQNWPLAYNAASITVSLIPLLTTRALEHSDTQHQTKDVVGLASDAAAIALRAGQPVYEALQLLEIGRGLVARALSDIRTDTTDLDEKYPSLAEKFNRLRDLLDTPKELRKGNQRYDTGKKFEELVQEIRHLPKFERFLLAPSEDDFRIAAASGPIVVINISPFGCHALLINQKELRALELSLDFEDAWAQVDRLATPDLEALGWIWDTVASPVLSALNFVQTPKHTWPRIWWIATGPLARFPIHAAGYYSNDEIHDTVMDRAISSYSSSVSAIIKAHQNLSLSSNSHQDKSMILTSPTHSPRRNSMVLISMTDTPGYSSLQYARKEIEVLAGFGVSMQLEVKQPMCYRKDTLSAINGCKIFHFAGHGYTSSSDPSKSALILSDGKLTVESIFDTNLQHKPFLAYLSACGTGQVKDNQLIDEGIHLMGAFQLAGFRHVIGTLQEVNDESCVEVARLTYEWMQKQGLSDSSVSEGLHRACRQLRSQWIQDNNVRTALESGMQSEKKREATSIQQRCHSARIGTRDLRDVELFEDLPLYWLPYVHFGI